MTPSLTAIIVTINRPDFVRRCLECLLAQEPALQQIIVVDGSSDRLTREVVADFPGIEYVRNEKGDGHTTHSRNLGVKQATGEIIAFLDDDAYAHPGWAAALLSTYTDPSIGAVGGRALRNLPGEGDEPVSEIGRFTSNGNVTGNFAVDSGKVIPVDHVIGCNMSFRREVIARCGGFREGFPGYCLREETDIFIVMKTFGYRTLFNPAAVVDHVAGPKPRGQRFDVRYNYFGERNHYVLLIRNFGPFAPVVWRYFGSALFRNAKEFVRRIGAALARIGAAALGTGVGIAEGIRLWLAQHGDPVRRDAQGREITRLLGQSASKPELVEVP